MGNEPDDLDAEPISQETKPYAFEAELGVEKATVLPSANQPAESPVAPGNELSAPEEIRDLPVSKAVVQPSAQKPAEPPKDAESKS